MTDSSACDVVRKRLRVVIDGAVAEERRPHLSNIDAFATHLERAAREAAAKKPSRPQGVSPARARQSLKKLSKLGRVLKAHIDTMPVVAVSALDRHLVARGIAVGTSSSSGEMAIDLAEEHILDLLDYTLRRLSVATDRADKYIADNPAGTEAWRRPGAAHIALLAWAIFVAVNSKPTRHWNVKKKKRESSPFIDFLDNIYKVLGVKADPARQARGIISYMNNQIRVREAMAKISS